MRKKTTMESHEDFYKSIEIEHKSASSQKPKKSRNLKNLKSEHKVGILSYTMLFAVIGLALVSYSFALKSDNKEKYQGVRGEVAIDILGKDLPAVAAKHNISPEKLKKLFLEDNTLEVDEENNLLYVEPGTSETEKGAQEKADKKAKKGAEKAAKLSLADSESHVAGVIAPTEAFNLNSNPTSTKTIYLDFDGHSNTYQTTVYSEPWDLDGVPTSFNDAERKRIIDIWKAVSEDYLPYNVNITTLDPGIEALKKSSSTDTAFGVRVVVSPTNWYGLSAAGVAWLGSFSSSAGASAWCFSGQLGTASYKGLAECVSHETGHSVNLLHDGYKTDGYYLGHGVWAPIMGAAYYRNVSQWSKGEYTDAINVQSGVSSPNTQDDLAVISSYLSTKADDVGNGVAAAKAMTSTGNGFSDTGLIGQTGDSDVYSFNWPGGAISATAITTVDLYETGKPATDLDASLRLLNANGQELFISDPAAAAPPVINVTIPAGIYYLEVKGVGYLDLATGYSNYASLGGYILNVASSTSTKPPPPPSNNPPIAKLSASPTSGTAPLAVTFSSAGSSDPEGKPLTYNWNFGDGQTSTSANPSVTYTTPGVYTVVLTVKDDAGLTASASTSITVQSTVKTMTVSSISALRVSSRKQRYAEVYITVTDNSGQPVSGVSVTGVWSGILTGTGSATTGADGKVMIRSKNVRTGGNVTFTVTNLVSSSTILNYVWDGVQKSVTVTL